MYVVLMLSNLTNCSRAENLDQLGSNEIWVYLASVDNTGFEVQERPFCGHCSRSTPAMEVVQYSKRR